MTVGYGGMSLEVESGVKINLGCIELKPSLGSQDYLKKKEEEENEKKSKQNKTINRPNKQKPKQNTQKDDR